MYESELALMSDTRNDGLWLCKLGEIGFALHSSVAAVKDILKSVTVANKLIISYLEDLPWVMLSWVAHTIAHECMRYRRHRCPTSLFPSLPRPTTHKHTHTPGDMHPGLYCNDVIPWCLLLLIKEYDLIGVWHHPDEITRTTNLGRNNKDPKISVAPA